MRISARESWSARFSRWPRRSPALRAPRTRRELGIVLKDPRLGLIDFAHDMGGRRVMLSWRLGEPEIQFWHEEDTGYSGRQPLAPSLVG